MISADGTAVYPWNHGEVLTAAGLNAAIAQSSGAYTGTTPPASPGPGLTWFNPTTGMMSVWTGSAWQPLSYLPLAGAVMQGQLTLAADPAAAMQPVTLQYYNAHAGAGGPFLPLAGGTISPGPLTVGNNPAGASIIGFNPATPSGMTSGTLFLAKNSGVRDGDSPQINSGVTVDYTGGANAYFHERIATTVTHSPGGGVWCLMNQSYFSGNNTSTMGHVGYYGQQVRTSVPASSIGVSAWCAVYELRSQTGLSSATDGVMTSVEIDCFANGADDMAGQIGRTNLSLVLGQNNTGGAAVEATCGISFYMLGGSTGHWKSQIFSAAPYSAAVLDTRNATPTSGSANAIWLGTNQTIALDTAGTGGASNVRLSGDGGNAVVTTTVGSTSIAGNGIRYSGVGGADNIGFSWSGTALNAYVNGSNQGALATQAYVGNYLPLVGGGLSGGLNFGSAVALGGNTDVTRHLALYSNTTGIGVTAGRVNYVGGSGNHVFMNGGADRLTITATGMGFNGTAAVAKPTISGACAGNTAIKALLTALASYGLVTDSTTA